MGVRISRQPEPDAQLPVGRYDGRVNGHAAGRWPTWREFIACSYTPEPIQRPEPAFIPLYCSVTDILLTFSRLLEQLAAKNGRAQITTVAVHVERCL